MLFDSAKVIQKFITMSCRWLRRREPRRKWQKQDEGGVAVTHMRLRLTEVVRGRLLSLSSEQEGFYTSNLSSTDLGACLSCRERNPLGVLWHVNVQRLAAVAA